MADYAISNVPRRVVYAASGVGPYAFTFEILAASDIAVYKGDTLLTLTTDYSVTINANGTGSITLVATAGTSNITIVGSKTIARTTDFTTGGDFFANTLNDELDAQTIFIQQVAETAERGMKAPVTDPTDINMTLPRKADRAGKYLAFDSLGNPEPGPTSTDVSGVAAIAAEVVIVSGIAADVTTVADNDANVTTVATNIGSVNTVSSSIANVNTTATNITNVNAVGADLLEPVSEINTVAVNIADVNTVGTNIASVNTNATNIVAIQNASTNATNAANSATSAANSATAANNSATAAAGSASTASSAADAALAALDSFDDRYLGQKTSDPSLDNDGNALVAGALYFNTTSDVMKVYEGSVWVAAYASLSGALLVANNLSDVSSASSARTNLGLGTAATQNTGAFATAAQGAKADTALQSSDIGTNVQAYSAALASYATNGVAMRNRIINGAMVIDQRNAGASVSVGAGDTTWDVDRWMGSSSQASKFTLQQSTTVPTGFKNSMVATVSSTITVGANDYAGILQRIEGLNIYDLDWGLSSAKTVTLSFWVRSSITGTYCISIRNSGDSRSYVSTYTINAANTWEQKSITIAGDTSGTWLTTNGMGMAVYFTLSCGSTYGSGTANTWSSSLSVATSAQTQWIQNSGATFYITGVQLEAGRVATPFEMRSYGAELALCQRYFYKFGSNFAYISGAMMSSTNSRGWFQNPVTMRSSPTGTTNITGYGTGANQIALFANNGYVSNSSFGIGIDWSNPLTISWNINTMSGTGGQSGSWDFGSGSYISLSAEL